MHAPQLSSRAWARRKRQYRHIWVVGALVLAVFLILFLLPKTPQSTNSVVNAEGAQIPNAIQTHSSTTRYLGFGELPAGIASTVKLESAGLSRQAIIDIPDGETPYGGWPVIFVFHGYKQTVDKFRAGLGFEAAPAIKIYPQGIDLAWQSAPYAKTNESRADETLVLDLLGNLNQSISLNWQKVFATGFSNGGGFAELLACRMPDVFAGIAGVAAAHYTGFATDCYPGTVPILDIRGTDDGVISYSGGERHKVHYLSYKQIIETARLRNHCVGPVLIIPLTPVIMRREATICAAPVRHISVIGGKHEWPGYQGSTSNKAPENFATTEILQFFDL
ncbi:alpha/beta hydrolase family esterase [Corynebacterium caspium]|uniref:alpha/beta hydrolase family esterase n=1 Tax=Corynebacterium caspium TaxID=234828 RepID=UPI00035FCB6E|nr:PHB depolymerase family esterase [Corynebacterium caspium]WKD59337.1 Esterase PHB depolymerase [Corynebacterium caspium DSM 44850]